MWFETNLGLPRVSERLSGNWDLGQVMNLRSTFNGMTNVLGSGNADCCNSILTLLTLYYG
jgi:hypothetical protein